MILQALHDLHRRNADAGNAQAYGYSPAKISYSIVLDRNGRVLDVQSLLDTSRKTPQPKSLSVPTPPKRTSGVAPSFLWDNTKYALGAQKPKNGTAERKWVASSRGEHEAFKNFHKECLKGASDSGLVALKKFVESWNPENFAHLRHAEDMVGAFVVFSLENASKLVHECDEAVRLVEQLTAERGDSEGLCLVTGRRGTIAGLHDNVKGVVGARSSGASLISFNGEAFESYGKERGANAPVSSRVASEVTKALNSLLEQGSRRRTRIGDTTTVFWAEESAAAAEAEDLLGALLEPPRPEEEESVLGDRLRDIANGRPVEVVLPPETLNAKFFVLGLSPNAARVSVRFWLMDSLGSLAKRIGDHWRDLRLEPDPWRGRLPSVWHLLNLIAPPSAKEKKTPPVLAGGLLRAVLQGSAYPASLLSETIQRLRVERGAATEADARRNDGEFRRRIAIVKAFVTRSRRLHQHIEEDSLVSLNSDSRDVAYNLGRLFGALVYAAEEVAARSATLRDRFIGAASATPGTVFPQLLLNYEHNRASLAKSEGWKPASAVRADKVVAQVVSSLPDGGFPATLSLGEQGRFFVGFYHQRQSFFEKSESSEESADHNTLEE